jgi:hypothetical protein
MRIGPTGRPRRAGAAGFPVAGLAAAGRSLGADRLVDPGRPFTREALSP